MKLSGAAFEAARLKSMGKEYETLQEISSEELKKLLDGVKEYNKQSAQNMISEMVLDIAYVKEKNTDITSLRLHRFLDYNREEYEEEK